jgi:hypothetical protein
VSLKSFQTLSFSDRLLSMFQDNVSNFTGQLVGLALLDGVDIQNVSLAVGSNEISHKLGRAPTGMLVASQTGAAVIWWNKTESKTQKLTAIIHSSAAVSADLYFFGG